MTTNYNLQFISKIALLEGSLFFNHTFPISVATSKKKEIQLEIRNQIKSFFKNGIQTTDQLVDVAIVIYVNDYRMKRQDVDNISKIVLDAISKNKNDTKKHPIVVAINVFIKLFTPIDQ